MRPRGRRSDTLAGMEAQRACWWEFRKGRVTDWRGRQAAPVGQAGSPDLPDARAWVAASGQSSWELLVLFRFQGVLSAVCLPGSGGLDIQVTLVLVDRAQPPGHVGVPGPGPEAAQSPGMKLIPSTLG